MLSTNKLWNIWRKVECDIDKVCDKNQNVRTLEDKHKAQLVLHEEMNTEKNFVGYKSANLKHSPLQITISFTSIPYFMLWSQDIIQANFQSDQPLKRPVYLILPKLLNVPNGTIRKLKKSTNYATQVTTGTTPLYSTSKITSDSIL